MRRRLGLVIALDRGEATDVSVSEGPQPDVRPGCGSASPLQALGERRLPDSLRPDAIASASSEPPPEAA